MTDTPTDDERLRPWTVNEMCDGFMPIIADFPDKLTLTLEPMTYYRLRFSVHETLLSRAEGPNGGVMLLGREFLPT